ncbi:MAG: molybdopterin-dependent oxidoreductase [Actinomycetota bacterium]
MALTPTATHWGPFLIESDGRRVTAVHDHPIDPNPSPIGQGLLAFDRCRVARPAVRRSWLEHGPGAATELRGREPFVEIEWDRALDLVAGELARVRDDHGHRAVYGGSYGWGSSGRFHMPSNQTYRFLRMYGGYTDARGTYSASAAETLLPHLFGTGYGRTIGSQTSWSQIVAGADTIVSFGSLRLNNAQVTFGGQGPHRTRHWLTEARRRGIRFINISPLRDDEPDDLDSRWVPVRPGTDTALMAGLLHTLVVEGRADEDFLARYTNGWPVLWAYLSGDDDGTAKTAAWAADICGVAEDEVVELARAMATGRTLINLSLSVQRGDHGEQTYWMALALACALGHVGLPGGGFIFPLGSNGNSGAGQIRKRVPGLPVPLPTPGMPVISTSRVVDMLEAPGEPYDFDGEAGVYPDIKLIYWAGGNVFHHHQDLNRLVEAWKRPETIVVHEPFWNPMAKRADIVLPVTTPLERNDLGGAETVLMAMHAAVAPVGQARDDYAVYTGLAERLGFAERFTEGRTADEWVRHLYEQFRRQNEDAPPYEEFWATGHLVHDMPEMGETEQVFLSAFRQDPDGAALPTASGRIELFSEVIEGFGYDDCVGHPRWYEPYERLGTEAAERWPLHLVSNQPRHRLHSQYDHSDLSRDTKVAGREPVRLHPADARRRGIAEGDVVRLFNERGACLAGAVLSDAVAEGVVQLATGAWYDPDDDGMCKHGNPNVLTNDKGTSRLAQGPTAHTCLVEVERYDGEPPTVTAFDPPRFIPEGGGGGPMADCADVSDRSAPRPR